MICKEYNYITLPKSYMADNNGPSHLKSLLEFTLMLSIRAFISVKCKLRLNVLINYTIIYTVYSQFGV